MARASPHRNVQPIGAKPATLNQRREQLTRQSVIGVWTQAKWKSSASRKSKSGHCPPIATHPTCETVAALAAPQIVVTVVDHQSDPVRDIERTKLGAQLHKQKCLPSRTSSFTVSQDSYFVFSVYPTDTVVPTAYECFYSQSLYVNSKRMLWQTLARPTTLSDQC